MTSQIRLRNEFDRLERLQRLRPSLGAIARILHSVKGHLRIGKAIIIDRQHSRFDVVRETLCIPLRPREGVGVRVKA